MLKRRYVGPLGLVAGLAALAATGCSEQNAALRVGDETYSHADLIDQADVQVAAFGDQLEAQLGVEAHGQSDDSYTQQYMGQVATNAVLVDLSGQYVEQAGDPLMEQGVQDQVSQTLADPVAAGLAPEFAELSEAEQTAFLEDTITVNNVAGQLQAQTREQFVSTLMTELNLDDDDIYINPRYGSWDPATASVVPPDGPLEQGGGGPQEAPVGSLPVGAE